MRDPWWQLRNGSMPHCARRVGRNSMNMSCAFWRAAMKTSTADIPVLAAELRRAWGLQVLVVTRGEAGALVLADDVTAELAPPARGEIVDTVGAGDSFSAVSIVGSAAGLAVGGIGEARGGLCRRGMSHAGRYRQ